MKHIVLIVDDDPGVLGLLKRKLEAEGYQVVTSQTGAEAVGVCSNAIREYGMPLTAVLLDLTLADMSGFDVLTKIRQNSPDLPVIMVTGSHNEEEARRAIELGALDYVTKPVDFEYLFNVLSLQEPDAPEH